LVPDAVRERGIPTNVIEKCEVRGSGLETPEKLCESL
jgi:hypothetical protein